MLSKSHLIKISVIYIRISTFVLREKNSLNFFIIISQVYGELDLVSALWSVEIIEHREVVIFKTALLIGKLQTNNVMTKYERSVV